MIGSVRNGLLVLTLARLTSAQEAPPQDLLRALGSAEVCPGTGEHCWPPPTSERLHSEGASADEVTLPGRAHTNLYIRVPPGGSLTFEYADVGTRLAVQVGTDSGGAREIYRRPEESASGAWWRAEIDLSPLAGKLLRLSFLPEPAPERGSGQLFSKVRGMTLRSRSRPSLTVAHPPAATRPNIVLYLIDTTRADHLGCYGYGRPTTPRIDAFAASAVLYTRAVAHSSWTLPSIASVLSGLTPNHHGALGLGRAIRREVPTLAEVLARNGYRTAAFVTNYLGSAAFGDARGFERFSFYPEQPDRRPGFYLPSSALYRRVARWLARHRPDEPFFLYVHATDPHWPYLPPLRYARRFLRPGTTAEQERALIEEYRKFFMGNRAWGDRPARVSPDDLAQLEGLYDGELRAADESFGRLIEDLEQRRLLDDTVIVLTSDHGEEFLDHDGMAHGQTLYDELTRVPLLIHMPGGRAGGTRVDALARHVDVMPTVLAAAGVPVPEGLDGGSLIGAEPEAAEAYALLNHMGIEMEAVSTTDWKVIRNITAGDVPPFEVYDLGHDPRERQDLAGSAPVLFGYGSRRVQELGAAVVAGPAVDPQLLQRLRALGYVKE